MMMTEGNQVNMPINEEPKNKKLKIIIIVVASVVFLGVAVFGVYNFIQEKKNERIEEKKKAEEKLKQQEEDELEYISNDSDEVVSLFTTITSSLTNPCGIDDYFMNETVNNKNVKNSRVFEMMSREIYKDKNLLYSNIPAGDTFTEEELNKKIVKYFGKNYKYTHKSINNCLGFTYDQTKKTYTVSGISTCEKACQYPTLKRVTTAKKSDKAMVLYVRVLFSDNAGKYYKDYDRTDEAKYLTPDSNGRYDTIMSNFSQAGLYKMKFTKENNNYVFTSSKKVEDVE